MATRNDQETISRCTFCPAGCRIRLVPAGVDTWRVEYPKDALSGLCPRGGAIGELLQHSGRIVWPLRRARGRGEPLSLDACAREVVNRAAGGEILFLLDGNLPLEEIYAAANCRAAWPAARLCLVIEPADEQLLLGIEASGAEYLPSSELSGCDGFVVVGDAFAANPICARGLLDRRYAEPRTPIVVIDPGAGTAWKFASHAIAAPPGGEYDALARLAAAAGLPVSPTGGQDPTYAKAAADAGRAIASCRRLGVLIAAEYGRNAAWRQIGHLAGRLAQAKGGAVAPQTIGANALAAVRLGKSLGTMPLADALGDDHGLRVVIGCDPLGMLGWCGEAGRKCRVAVAASALPNCTTEAAEFVLSLAMNGEMPGTYLFDNSRPETIPALLPPPAGVPTPSELIAAFAREAGARVGAMEGPARPPDRSRPQAPEPPSVAAGPPGPVLLLARQARDHGCGSVTGHASWQLAMTESADLRFSADSAEALGLESLQAITVGADGAVLRGRVRIDPELPAGTVVFPEAVAARSLLPSRMDPRRSEIVSEPVSFPPECLT